MPKKEKWKVKGKSFECNVATTFIYNKPMDRMVYTYRKECTDAKAYSLNFNRFHLHDDPMIIISVVGFAKQPNEFTFFF